MLKLYIALARSAQWVRQANDAYIDIAEERVKALAREHLPSGSGFDSGSHVDTEGSTDKRLVITSSFHMMNEAGFYTHWLEFRIEVKPELCYGFDLRVIGAMPADMRDYIGDRFHEDLSAEVDYDALVLNTSAREEG